MLRKVLWKNQGIGKLLLAFVGAFLGLFLFLFSLQFYQDIQSLLTQDDLFGSSFLVVNKEVSLLNMAGVGSTGFRESELEDLKSQPFIEDVAPFVHSTFKTYASIGIGGNEKEIRTDIFFEAIPDAYLDLGVDKWGWEGPADEVSIALPADYLKLYNFGFSQSYGLPQVSAGTIGMARIKLRISGKNQSETFYARIAGFSDRINAILVPQDFIEYANEKFGEKEVRKPSRVLLVCNDPAHPDLEHYLKEEGYETNREKLKNSRMQSMLKIVIGVLTGISFLIIALALIVFTLSFQLIITGAREEIQLMLHLGTKHGSIASYYLRWFALILAVLGIGIVGLVAWLKAIVADELNERNFTVPEGIDPQVYLALAAVLLVFLLVNAASVYGSLRKLAH